jgi:N-acylneuraminate cytidylyltransferase
MENKNIKDICLIIQARLNSQRVPNKMLKPFVNTTLIDILFEKLKKSTIIPKENIYLSSYEPELKVIANKHGINIFNRSKESSLEESNPLKLWEWHNKLPYKYVIAVSACNPLLKIETIDKFVKNFMNSNKEGAFAVFEKKTYYWDKNKKPITDWGGKTTMNTKYVDPVYEAAHCLYASRMDIIKDGYFIDTKSPMEPELFIMDELEAFDIDEPWQFKVAEQLYRNKKELWKK